jgi:hypothetical protein
MIDFKIFILGELCVFFAYLAVKTLMKQSQAYIYLIIKYLQNAVLESVEVKR